MSSLFINDLFWTLQGEGQNAGRRSLFVRMPFCNLACTWCDTSFNTYTKMSENDFLSFAQQEEARFAVITGGEPFMHKHTPRVISLLKDLGYEIAAETNGSFPPPLGVDFITCSPKRDNEYSIHANLYDQVAEFKYVVDQGFDFSILDIHKLDPAHQRHSLSPEFNRMDASVKEILAYIKANPRWRLSLQTHKWIGIS